MSKKPNGKIIFVIEAPGKIEKLYKILDSDKYFIIPTKGHFYDLPEKRIAVDTENNFKPEYEITSKGGSVVESLITAYSKGIDIIIATDPDREGEMIGWSVAEILNLKKPKRVRYTDITKSEVLNSIKNASKLDDNLIEAAKARRILDRLVGYMISPLVQKTIGDFHLSAGRVQSVALRLVVDREKEIMAFMQSDNESYFRCSGSFMNGKNRLDGKLYSIKKQIVIEEQKEFDEDKKEKIKVKVEDENNEDDKEDEENTMKKGYLVTIDKYDNAMKIMKSLSKSIFTIGETKERTRLQNASAPFSTSSMLKDAGTKLGFPIKKTTMAAQKLYEAGHITYIRTDSVNLSDDALNNMQKYIINTFGKEYHQRKQFKTKVKNAQEAHEAIRPTHIDVKTLQGVESDQARLYELIWKRTIASQMKPAKYNVLDIKIDISKLNDYHFLSSMEELIFPGFLLVYNISDIEKEGGGKMNKLKKKSELDVIDITSVEDYKRPKPRFNDISLAEQMKVVGIGRPATTPNIIATIEKRKYINRQDMNGVDKKCVTIKWDGKKINEESRTVSIGKETKKFVPTQVGLDVVDFLVTKFPKIVDYEFTAKMEDNLDDVSNGKKTRVNVLKKFFEEFEPIVTELKKTVVFKESTNKHKRLLGIHPKLKNEIYAVSTRNGPAVKMCMSDDPKDCRFANIDSPLTLENITLDDALELLVFPKTLGKYKDDDVILKTGKFGPYISNNDKSYSLKHLELSRDELLKLKLSEAIKLIESKNEEQDKKSLWNDSDDKFTYNIQMGKYGPYVIITPKGSKRGEIVGLPKDIDGKFDKLKLDELKQIIKEKKEYTKTHGKYTKKTTGGYKKKVGGYKKQTGKRGKRAKKAV